MLPCRGDFESVQVDVPYLKNLDELEILGEERTVDQR